MKSVDIRTVDLTRVEDLHEASGFRATGIGIADLIGAERIGAALFEIADADRLFPYHYHHGVEEWLIVVDGTPTLRTPDGEQVLRAGDCVCFPSGPEGAHALRGPGRVLMISTGSQVSMPVYVDSDKLGVRPEDPDSPDRLNFRRADAVDYWDGE